MKIKIHWRRLATATTLLTGCAVMTACASTAVERPSAGHDDAPATTTAATTAPAEATSPGDVATNAQQTDFQRWVAQFRAQARARGVAPATLEAAFADVALIPQIIELDSSQPEFNRRVWSYLDALVTTHRVRLGREQLARYADIATRTERRFGVPRDIIGAIWGVESNYGRNFGDYDTVSALATLAFDGRRRDFAVRQLYAVFDIIASGAIEADALRGSWAGAMGHTQFIPTSYLAYAVDGDGDGRIDIWHSIADVMASTANYLNVHGWQTGSPWGVEVVLPADFNYAQATLSRQRPTQAWMQQGVRSATDRPLPHYTQASILARPGRTERRFSSARILKSSCPTTIPLTMRWRWGCWRIAWLADPSCRRVARGLEPLSNEQARTLQGLLNRIGFSTGGAPDGIIGPNTRAGIRAFQRAHGLVADGFATQQLLQRVRREAGVL